MDAEELIALYEEEERNFQGLDLSGTDLNGANLSSADLSGANLSDTNLSDAYLNDVNLSDADLSGADLSSADLSDANLSNADLSDANLNDANLSGANLSDTNLSDAYLNDANLSDANLSGANLSDVDLSGADLSGADLSGVDLSGVDLSVAKLNWVNFKSTIIDSHTKLEAKWYFVWQIMNGKLESLKQKPYYQLCLFNSFDHNHYVGKDLSNACLKNLELTELNLSFSILYRADCQNTNFTDTNLYCANFHSANLRGSNFTNADLRYAILIDADLRGADLTNADLRYANLHGVDLKFSKIEGAKILQFDDISCSWNQLDDDQFEELCYDILLKEHDLKLTNIDKIDKSRSRDGGRDIVFSKGVDINKKPIKWIAQCKLKSDKGSLGKSQVPDILDMLKAQEAKGFCIMTSGIIGATLHDSLDSLRDKNGIEVEKWSYLEIERFLAEHPEIKARYFKN
jgi:uncharacterized protein YjbI with pentapeptide repeats